MSEAWIEIGMDAGFRTLVFTAGCALFLALADRLNPLEGLRLRLCILAAVPLLAIATVALGIGVKSKSHAAVPPLPVDQANFAPAPSGPEMAVPRVAPQPSWRIGSEVAQMCLIVWAAGAMVWLVRIGSQTLQLRRCRRGWPVVRDSRLCAIWIETCRRHGWRRTTPLLLGGRGHTTFVVGWLRPAVVAPIELVEQANAETVAAILGHEIAHLKRGDLTRAVWIELLRGAFWWNPLVHWIAAQSRALTEIACDLDAVRVFKDRRRYAQAVLAEAARVGKSRRTIATLCHVETPFSLEKRITQIMKGKMNTTKITQRIGLMALLAVGAAGTLFLGLRVAVAQDTGQKMQPVPFELKAKKPWPSGDEVIVEEVLGTVPRFQVGETYVVRGHYSVRRLSNAVLLVGNTSENTSAIAYDGPSQIPVETRERKPFEQKFEILAPGQLHVSLYDLARYNPSDNCVGGVLLVEKEPLITVEFANEKVEAVLAFLTSSSGRKIHYSLPVDATPPLISVKLVDVPIGTAVNYVATLASLKVESHDGEYFLVDKPR